MAYTYTIIDGKRVQTSVAKAFYRMAADFQARFGLTLHVNEGTRTWDEQMAFYEAYKNGTGNLALHPSNPLAYHVETNPSGPRALDIYDSGSDAGVTQAGNARSNWIRENAHRYGFNPAGYSFSKVEPWHIEFTGPLVNEAAPTPTPTPTPVTRPQEDFMKIIRWNNFHCFAVAMEAIYHIPNGQEVGELNVFHGATIEVDNHGLTTMLLSHGIHWDAVDAVLKGKGFGTNGKYWSRLQAEGVAIRGNQAAAAKTLDDVLKTAKAISK